MSLLAPVSKSVKGLLNRALFLPDPKGRNEDGSAANWSKDFYDAYLETMYIIRDSTDPKDLKNASKFLSKRSSSILWAIFSSRELLKLLLRQIWDNPATFL